MAACFTAPAAFKKSNRTATPPGFEHQLNDSPRAGCKKIPALGILQARGNLLHEPPTD
jgi:hypothetical protein